MKLTAELRRVSCSGDAATILWSWSALSARADIIDVGVDILSGGGTTQVADGFWGDSTGYTLANSCLLVLCSQNSYTFYLDTTTMGTLDLESAELSFDVSGLSLLETFTVFAFRGTYQFLGNLGTGPLSLNLSTFGDEIANGLLSIRVSSAGLLPESVRLDGANRTCRRRPSPCRRRCSSPESAWLARPRSTVDAVDNFRRLADGRTAPGFSVPCGAPGAATPSAA
jgi:hypothetical protein